MVGFNWALLTELCRQVEDTDDPESLTELSDEIVRLINDNGSRWDTLTLDRRGYDSQLVYGIAFLFSLLATAIVIGLWPWLRKPSRKQSWRKTHSAQQQ